MVVLTREPDRTLDVQGRTWVASFDAWRVGVGRQVTTARRGLTLTAPAKNARLLEPLRGCGRALARIGEPPELLGDVRDAAAQACGEAEVALAKNDQFGVSALATTELHLAEVEDKLRLARHNLRLALDEPL
jgi:hypothetical protein